MRAATAHKNKLTWPAALLAACCLLCAASVADAETVVTTMATAMHKEPGESTKVVLKLRPGARLRVLKRDGRWIHVRVGRRVGWVTRTTVQKPGAEEKRKKEPTKWGKRRVEALEHGNEAPSSATYTTFGKPGHDGKSEDALLLEKPGASSRKEPPNEPSTAPLDPTRLGVRLGMQSLSMDFHSDGATGIGNYRISTRAMTVEIGGRFELGGAAAWKLALDAGARTGRSSPGIRYESSTGQVGDIAYAAHEARAGLSLGYRLTSAFGGTTAAVRVGYHYGVFAPDDIYNHGKLPRESLRGATTGLRLHLPTVRDGLSLTVEADLLVGGQRAQTVGLEDGTVDEVSAFWGGAAFSYPVSGHLGLMGSYRYGQASTSWTGPSTRQPEATEASRDDREHLVLLGLAYAR